jgi:molecular chaperone DnaJ
MASTGAPAGPSPRPVHTTADHYAALGVSATATRDQIRDAYRRLARANHPDSHGDSSAARMAAINAAWHVLSDPGRRAMYDASRRPVSSGGSSAAGPSRSPFASSAAPMDVAATPGRFPWRFLLVIATIGIAFVIVNAALAEPDAVVPPDNLLEPGSCVSIEDNGDAREVLCNGANDGVVKAFIALDATCPVGTERHRDRQGMGLACVVIGTSG